MMQDRAVPLAEFSDQLRAQAVRTTLPNFGIQRVASVSVSLPTEVRNDASLIKDRVNSLLHIVDDEEDQITETEDGDKKRRFGFFRKK